MGDSSCNIAILYDVTFFVTALNEVGKCASCRKVVEKFKYKDRTIKLISPKSSNDNCLFMCFVSHLKKW